MGWFKKRDSARSKSTSSGERWVGHSVNITSKPCIGRIVNRPEETWFVIEPTGAEFPTDPEKACRHAVKVLIDTNSVSEHHVSSRELRISVSTNFVGQREFTIEIGGPPVL